MKDGFIGYKINDQGTATVTLTRSKVNALNGHMQKELTNIFQAIKENNDVQRVVLKAGTPCDAFCAGVDVDEMKDAALSLNPQRNIDDCMQFARMLDAVASCGKPILGIIKKSAVGAGSTLAALCDYAVASTDAQFGYPERKMNLKPSVSAPYIIARIGAKNAMHHFLAGDIFNAEEARKMGIVHETCAPEQLARREVELTAAFEAGHLPAVRKPEPLYDAEPPTTDPVMAALVIRAARLMQDRSEKGREELIEQSACDLAACRLLPEVRTRLEQYDRNMHHHTPPGQTR